MSFFLLLRPERRSFRHDTLFEEAPQRDRELSCQCDNANLAAAHPHAAEPLTPPKRKFTVWLISQPEPSEFYQRLAGQLCAGLVDPTITAHVAAGVRAWRKSNERRDVSSAFNATVVNFSDKDGGRHLADSSHFRQPLNFFTIWKARRLIAKSGLAIRLDFRDLFADELMMSQHSFKITAEKWRQWSTVARFDRIESFRQFPVNPFSAKTHAMKSEKPFDPANNPRAFFNEVFPLAFDPFSVFLCNGRNVNGASHCKIARKPSP
jgi:hypothetical protein